MDTTGSTSKRKYEDTDYFSICVTAVVNCGLKKQNICQNRILEYSVDCSWDDVYQDITYESDFRPHKTDTVEVNLSDKLNGATTFFPDIQEGLHVVKNFNKCLKYVVYKTTRNEDVGMDNSTAENIKAPQKSALLALMTASTAQKLPQSKDVINAERFTAKDECGDKFPGSMYQQGISEQVMTIVNALWYVSGNMATIEERAAHQATVKHIPERFLKFDGANDYKRKKHKRPQLTAKDLKLQSQCLFRPFTQQWSMRCDIETLTFSLQSYAEYLEQANVKQTSRQLQMNPVRQIDSSLSIAHRPAQDDFLPCYSRLDGRVTRMPLFQPLFFDEDLHITEKFKGSEQRFRYFEKLSLSVPVHMLRYDPGGGIGAISFLWRVPEDEISSEEIFF